MSTDFLSFSRSAVHYGRARALLFRLTLLLSAILGLGITASSPLHAQTLTILHNFQDGTVPNDGYLPIAALIQGRDGNFYGTTSDGGSTGAAGDGTVFKITPAGAVTILHSFADGTVTNDGLDPQAALVQGTDGNFYGTTEAGGSTATTGQFPGDGTVFKMTPAGAVTILHSFADGTITNDATSPRAALVQGADGNFYGTTYTGAVGDGAVFKITPSGAVTILHGFDDGTVKDDGRNPHAALVQANDGNFYGTTVSGGSTAAIDVAGSGTIFKITPAGAVTILHSFGDGTVTNDGVDPHDALVQGADGNFFGTTYSGGSTAITGQFPGDGTVFKLSLPSFLTWTARDTAAPDGTARLLWTRGDGTARIWIMNTSDAQSALGPTYGPIPGWTAKAVSVSGDGTSRLLWTNADGEAGIWTLDASGNATAVGPAYGPFADWTASDIATAPNGTSRILWTNTNGEAGVWTFNSADVGTVIGTTNGPFAGWTAKAVGAAGDGTARVLWTNANGEAGLWSFNANDEATTVGPTYGPFAGWSASDVGTSSDGTSNVLWTNTNGMAGVWTFSAADAETTIGAAYGPFTDWTAAALDSANDQSRVLWVNTSRAAGLWSFGTNDTESLIGLTYGPY